MFSYDFKKRVRYAETDKMGYLYYGNYAAYYEMGRVESIRALGLNYKDLEDHHKIMLPVLSLQCRFAKPAYYDDLLTIRSMLKEIPQKMITFHHEIINEAGEIINKGEVKLFFVDMENNTRISAPDFFIDKLNSYFE